MPHRRTAAALFLLGLAAAAPAEAKEYNKRPFLESGKQAKVENAIAQGMLLSGQGQATASRFSRVTNTDCGKLEVGTVKDPKKTPRDLIVVTGDIINVAQNCGTRR